MDPRIATFRDGPAPDSASASVRALWHVAHGEWDMAHGLVQDDPSRDAAWVHAHLHRVEGDLSNAAYWYRMAHRPECRDAIDQEWACLVAALLMHSGMAASPERNPPEDAEPRRTSPR